MHGHAPAGPFVRRMVVQESVSQSYKIRSLETGDFWALSFALALREGYFTPHNRCSYVPSHQYGHFFFPHSVHC